LAGHFGLRERPKFREVSGTFPALARTRAASTSIDHDFRGRDSALGSPRRATSRQGDSKGFFFVDRSPGGYQIATSTEVDRTLSLTLEQGQIRFVRLDVSMGFMVGHVYPVLVDDAVGKKEIENCSYTGTSGK